MRAPTLLLLCLAAGGCGGLSGSHCHALGDCVSGLVCIGPDEGPSCGIAPMHGCSSTTDCTGGFTCHAISDGCSQTGVGSECRAPCGTCETGFRCNSSGACEPVPCDEGFTCSVLERCDTTAAHSMGAVFTRSSGCVRISCSKDTDCAATQACVNGECQSGPGSCGQSVAVP